MIGGDTSLPTPAATNRIDTIFAALRAEKRKAIMPFVCAGSPSLAASMDAIKACADAGASVCEIGIPFSDPIADGPVIAGAMHEALEAGVRPNAVLDAVADVRASVDIGLVAMVSVSIVQRIGAAAFVARAASAGIDGFIFPDVPVHEAGELSAAAMAAGCTASLLVAPSTPMDRAQEIADASSGFVYVLARSGITGEQGGGPAETLRDRVASLRGVTALPLAVGFGIAQAEHVRQVVRKADADAAIVGSALVRAMQDAGADRAASTAESFVRELATGLDNPA